jgi:hypothetical protein
MSMAVALTALDSTLHQYFDGIAGAGQSTELSLVPEKSLSPGIGAYVGTHDDPAGEITALRIDTVASIKLEAPDADIGGLVQDVTSAVMGVERAELQQAGIYRLKMRELEPVIEVTGSRSSRVINFSLLYEHLVLPTESEFQIEDIVLDLDLNAAMGDARVIINTGFDTDWQNIFDVVDDPDAVQNPPSNWQFDAGEVALHQDSAIQGGSFALTARKSGTYLLLKAGSDTPPVQDFLLDVDLSSADNDGVGFVFRYQDIDNFYFCVLSARNDYAMLGKKTGGVFGFLDQDGQANVIPYQLSTTHRLKLVALGNQFQVYVDDNPLVSGTDDAITGIGQVGLMCHGNDNVFFYRLQLLELLSG